MTRPECDQLEKELAAAFPLRDVQFSNAISLRPLRADDLAPLTDVLGGDPSMSWTRKSWTVANIRYLLDLRLAHYEAHNFGIYGVVESESRKLIGMTGLQFWDDSSCDVEVITYIQRTAWNRGLGTAISVWCCSQAFAQCPSLPRIVAATRHDNAAAQAVARHLHMTRTGEGAHYDARSIFWSVDRPTFEEAVRAGA